MKKNSHVIVPIGFECHQCCRFIKEPRRRSGICLRCGVNNVCENISQLRVGFGPLFEKHLAGLEKYLRTKKR